ncbi:MAG: cyclic nucleotide-binding domain-containing protein [Mariprofundaceae bacterium]
MIHGKWVAGEEGDVRPAWGGPFLPLEKEVKHSFLSRKRRREIREGEILFRAGDVADKIYLITEGELAISIRTELTGPMLINLAYRGDLVGESALQADSMRTADVFANKDSILLEFSMRQLKDAFTLHPGLRDMLEEEASLRRKIALLTRCQPFSLLNLSERIIVAEQSLEKHVPAGTIIKHEKSELPFAALVVSGEIESYFTIYQEQQYAGSLYNNSLFGLSMLYLNKVSPYKLIAKNNVSLLTIPHIVLEDASQTYSNFDSSVCDIAKTSFSQTMETIRILSSNIPTT